MNATNRARAYMQKMPPAIAGEGGHDSTFAAACAAVRFGLAKEQAWSLLLDWNRTHCRPEWSEGELRHKLEDAFTKVWPDPRYAERRPRYRPPVPSGEDKRSTWPQFVKPTRLKLAALGELRNVSAEGLELAVRRDLLWTATFHRQECWIITDPTRRNAQARCLDGKPFSLFVAPPRKAWTLPGSTASLPVGLAEADPFANVMLVEGGPDLLAAFHFIAVEGRTAGCHAVAMLGASHRIPESSLPGFRGKHVRLFPHVDREGREAGSRWGQSLAKSAARVDIFDFSRLRRADGHPVKDLNDLCFVDPDEFEANRDLWTICP